MSKSFLMGARVWDDTNEQKAAKGLIVQMNGLDDVIPQFTDDFEMAILRSEAERIEKEEAQRTAEHDEANTCAKVQTSNAYAAIETATSNFVIIDYSEKALAVFGDTRPIKNRLMAIGGRFNAKLTHEGVKTAGWVFSKTKEKELRNLLTIK